MVRAIGVFYRPSIFPFNYAFMKVFSMRGFAPIILGLIVLCMVAVGAPAQETEESVEEYDSRAYLEGKYFGSIAEASYMQNKVLTYYENKYGFDSVESVPPMEALAWMSLELNDYKRAVMLYERIIRIRNGKMQASFENTQQLIKNYYLLGDSYMYQGQYDKAASYYDESIRFASDPEARGDVIKRKGFIYEQQKHYEEAITNYLDAIKKYELALVNNDEKAAFIRKKMLAIYEVIADVYEKMGNSGKSQVYKEFINGYREEFSL